MGFLDLAKHGLNKHGISEDQIWSPKREREPYREGEKRGKERIRRRERGREEEEKKRNQAS